MEITGTFKVLLDGELIEFTKYNDIPLSFDNLIECIFDYPEGPHTQEEHNEMDKFNEYLQQLMSRETR